MMSKSLRRICLVSLAKFRNRIALAFALCFVGTVDHTFSQNQDELLGTFINQWCLDCHSSPRPKADLDLGAALDALKNDDMWPVWRDVQARLIAKDMPPKGEKPSDAEYQELVAQLKPIVAALPITDDGRVRTTMRRLNRAEYANTIADLFFVDFNRDDLPVDEIGHGFDNNGDVLSISPLLFEKYMNAAERIAQAAFVDLQTAEPALVQQMASELHAERGAHLNKKGWVLFTNSVVEGEIEAVHSGRYRFEAEVAGKQAGPDLVEVALFLNGVQVKKFEVSGDMRRQKIGSEIDLESGVSTFGVGFLNDYYDPKNPKPRERDRNAHLWSISLEGPLDIPSPTKLQVQLNAKTENLPESERFSEQVRILASMAWRRPVDDTEVEPLLNIVTELVREDQSNAQRLRIALTALLVHPRFLFRIEADPRSGEAQRTIDAWEWATRVSYFLWSSAPDAILTEAAASGALNDSAGRKMQLDRMIEDPRAAALAERFGAQWLQIDGLDQLRPDPSQFGDFTDELLSAMRAETVLVFDAILKEGRPMSDLLEADWTFMNEALARHYGIPGVNGSHMRRVSLDPELPGVPDRMGIFRHASVLLATSNPTRTSPVKRGKWVLEVLFDDPTPPPPANVDGLPEDGRVTGKTSLRALLEAHRSDPACASCHKRLDPLGFALEPFDAVGRWREHENNLPIDDAARLPDGTLLDGPQGLRDLLLARPDFIRSCCRHLLTYALGRGLSKDDENQVDEILNGIGPNPSLRVLVLAVIECESFRTRRAEIADPSESSSSSNARRNSS